MEEITMSANKEYQPKTKKELKRAIQEYQQGKHKERGEPNDWDVSLITDMSQLFWMNNTFNEPLNKWVTKQVTNMKGMFSEFLSSKTKLNACFSRFFTFKQNRSRLQQVKSCFYSFLKFEACKR